MISVIQRVSSCAVRINGETHSAIGPGLLVLLGVRPNDTGADAASLADKIVNLRIFEDGDGKMNRSLLDTKGQLMVVSQFTLCADCRQGRRPSFTGAAAPELGERLYDLFIEKARATGVTVATGQFGAKMQVDISNDGPVTLTLDTSFSLK